MLVVLEDARVLRRPEREGAPAPLHLPKPGAKLPPSSQLWAWAHVHVNRQPRSARSSPTTANAIEDELDGTLAADPDLAYSRIVCPRRLRANTAYHACRRAGVRERPARRSRPRPRGRRWHDTLAWTDRCSRRSCPYHHRWYFRTGAVGDFEYLVRLLEPQPIDSRVGIRDMDVQKPGANLRSGIVDAPTTPPEQRLEGILKLGGALRIPDILYSPEEFAEVVKYRKWATLNDTQPYPHPFQSDLAAFVNLADSYTTTAAAAANASAASRRR